MLSGRSQRWIKQARGEKGRRQGGTILRKNHRFENQDLDRLLMISGNGPTKRRQAAVHMGHVFKTQIAQISFFAGSDREELGNSPEVRNI